MYSSRIVTTAFIAAASVDLLTGSASASTRGYDMTGDPWTGLVFTLIVLIIIVAFAVFYLFIDRFEQRRVNLMKKNRDVEGLIKALKSSWLSSKAALALGEVGDERAVGPLIEALGSRYVDTREAAADALGHVGDERAIGKLNIVLDDNYITVREHARIAIENIRNRISTGGNGNGSY
ncbi:MAG TPA: HEAT repeat domain-containing protein [Methanocella sp.]|nr:HEAT repeat domain-containing protein [Methanocella sp.]